MHIGNPASTTNHVYDILRSRKRTIRSLENEHKSTDINLCCVCGDISSGNHYGALSCDGCRGFFKRCVRFGADFVCVKLNSSCQINPNNRTRCQFCRYQKCLAVGMTKSAVQNPRISRTELSFKENYETPTKFRRKNINYSINDIMLKQRYVSNLQFYSPTITCLPKREISSSQSTSSNFGFNITNLINIPQCEHDIKDETKSNNCRNTEQIQDATKLSLFDLQRLNQKFVNNNRFSNCGLMKCENIEKYSASKLLNPKKEPETTLVKSLLNKLIDCVSSSQFCDSMTAVDRFITLQAVWRPLFLLLIARSDEHTANNQILDNNLAHLITVIRSNLNKLKMNENEEAFVILVELLIGSAFQTSNLYNQYSSCLRSFMELMYQKVKIANEEDSVYICMEIMGLVGLCMTVIDANIESAIKWPGTSFVNLILEREWQLRS